MECLCLVVPRAKGEEVRRALLRMGVLRSDVRIAEREGYILLPLIREVDIGYPLETHDLPAVPQKPKSYTEVVRVPYGLRPYLPRSFDLVGDVAILKVPRELQGYEEAIGKAILQAMPGVRCVAVDEGVQGPLRTRRLRVVAGRRQTRTVHREYGLVLAVDPGSVYFSPRMATERHRVALQVRPGEVVVDAFAGVGPFALQVARRGAKKVYAIDSNPRAIEFLRQNIRLNRLENVVPLEGDAAHWLRELHEVDRVILDFPQDPMPYFPLAAAATRPGGMIHYYEILERVDLEERLEDLRQSLPADFDVVVLTVREVRGYSPTQAHYAMDLRVVRG